MQKTALFRYSLNPYSQSVIATYCQHPFGMLIKERAYSSDSYRFGFNGKEKDDEISGEGNNLDFGARIYDNRLGRFSSIDPLIRKYPSLNGYNFVADNPIFWIDGNGREIINPYDKETEKENYLKVQRAINIVKLVMPKLYNEFHNNPDFKITITINNLSDYKEEHQTDNNISISDNIDVHQFGEINTPVYGAKIYSVEATTEKGKEYRIMKNEWDEVENKVIKKEISMDQVKGLEIGKDAITIKLHQGLFRQVSLGYVLAHELGHLKYNLSNTAKWWIESLAKKAKFSKKDSSEEAARETQKDFSDNYKKTNKEEKKNADKGEQ